MEPLQLPQTLSTPFTLLSPPLSAPQLQPQLPQPPPLQSFSPMDTKYTDRIQLLHGLPQPSSEFEIQSQRTMFGAYATASTTTEFPSFKKQEDAWYPEYMTSAAILVEEVGGPPSETNAAATTSLPRDLLLQQALMHIPPTIAPAPPGTFSITELIRQNHHNQQHHLFSRSISPGQVDEPPSLQRLDGVAYDCEDGSNEDGYRFGHSECSYTSLFLLVDSMTCNVRGNRTPLKQFTPRFL